MTQICQLQDREQRFLFVCTNNRHSQRQGIGRVKGEEGGKQLTVKFGKDPTLKAGQGLKQEHIRIFWHPIILYHLIYSTVLFAVFSVNSLKLFLFFEWLLHNKRISPVLQLSLALNKLFTSVTELTSMQMFCYFLWTKKKCFFHLT